MPKISDIEDTPNPNAKKFILKDPLTWGISHSYESAIEAAKDPLATALFAIDHVTSVFYVDHWLTVTQDGQADWGELLRKIAEPIREAPSADEHSTHNAAAADLAIREMTPENLALFEQIKALLDERVRPYLQGDGGDLHLLGLENDTLTIHYQGACGSCPSSLSGTLMAISNLVRSINPNIEVVAI
jgi:Fe-S cluster biogenesis protein NfuA